MGRRASAAVARPVVHVVKVDVPRAILGDPGSTKKSGAFPVREVDGNPVLRVRLDRLQNVGTYVFVPTIRNRKINASAPSRMAVFRPRDVEGIGLSRTALGRLVTAGTIERVGRGLYAPSNARVTKHHTLVEAAKRVPLGVVCLLSALQFHGLTTQNPHEVWMAIDGKARKPVADWPPLHILRFSGEALTYGIEPHGIEGVEVRLTSREKTVADCFKYRNKIGLDVALEALRGYLRSKRRSVDDLVRAAEVCRVDKIMRPYLEGIA